RWRAFAMFGGFGGGATWAEGAYEMTYAKENGVWKIKTLDYHSGFAAPYTTGWAPPAPPAAAGAAGSAPATGAGAAGPAAAGAPSAAASASPPAPRGPRNLPYPPDRPRDEPCAGFPAACPPTMHYTNLGATAAGHIWTTVDLPARAGKGVDARDRAADLARRAQRLDDEQTIENLQKIYGYYVDRRMWDEVADLFADNGTIEMAQMGIYVGKARVRQFLNLLGPQGIKDGELNDHVQLQVVVDVAGDGRTAKSRSRELDMLGTVGGKGYWSEGVFENTWVKDGTVWKLKDLRYFPTFVSDYDLGWAKDAQPAPAASKELPPDRPPTSVYAIYPKAHIPPYHYDNPVSALAPRYPEARGRPSDAAIKAIRAPVDASKAARAPRPSTKDVDALVAQTESEIGRVKDFYEIDNLVSGYGYYLDKNLWTDLANLFSEHGTIELAQRGVYVGRERVRAALFNVFGKEGPQENRLGNHIQWQAVIHVAPDGQSAKARSRMMQQLAFGPRPSMGASLYENEFVKEDGVWKYSVDHTYNTWGANYEGGWVKQTGRGGVPGPSKTYPPDTPPSFRFQMFPTVYEIPFHYAHPVTGKPPKITPVHVYREPTGAPVSATGGSGPAAGAPALGVMPPEIAAQLREIGAKIETQKTLEIYAPLQPKEPYAWLDVARDQRYGPAERNVLDVFAAPKASPDRSRLKPVVLFVHGGGFARGAKHTDGTPFYDNIGVWAVAYGLVGATMNYRLAPESTWPSGIEDVGAAVKWLQTNAAQYGGDPKRIFLWGHSAGAAHVGDYLADAATKGRDAGVAGAILTSGFYDLGKEVSVWKVYYGDDVAKYPERSSLPGLVKSATPLLVTDAELDPDMFQAESNKLAAARAAAGKPVQRVHLAGHSHISETYAVGTADRALSAPVLDFVRGAGAKGGS
ncbi:MAG TPA: nuclear transport factor 2 family protein, partial [Gammaproteobacteria bacterium]|nr:nuclear transport factor 2 family protein [Gammaproteobacteria bacterium]